MRKTALPLAAILLAASGAAWAQEETPAEPAEPAVEVEESAPADAAAPAEAGGEAVAEEGTKPLEFFEQAEESERRIMHFTLKAGLHNFLDSGFFEGPGSFPTEDDLMGPNYEVELDLRFHEHYSFAVSGGLFEGKDRKRDGSKLDITGYHVEGHARIHSGPIDFGDFFAGAGITVMFLEIEGASRDPAVNFGNLNKDDTNELGYGVFAEIGWEIPLSDNLALVIEDRLGIDRTSTDLSLPGQKSSKGWFSGNVFQGGVQIKF